MFQLFQRTIYPLLRDSNVFVSVIKFLEQENGAYPFSCFFMCVLFAIVHLRYP